eukprot:11568418-Alexandrium_andersonii.AAC.1
MFSSRGHAAVSRCPPTRNRLVAAGNDARGDSGNVALRPLRRDPDERPKARAARLDGLRRAHIARVLEARGDGIDR